jgi:hypothetical protein
MICACCANASASEEWNPCPAMQADQRRTAALNSPSWITSVLM